MWFLAFPVVLIAAAFVPRKNAKGETVSLKFKDIFGPFERFGPFMNDPVAAQALVIAKQYLIENEGKRDVVYKDSVGVLTVGIGHKVLPADGLVLGQKISESRIGQFFNADVARAFSAAKSQAHDLGKYNSTFIAALIEVNFQLGTGWKNEFANTYRDLKNDNPDQAINRLKQSKWYKQTPNRVANFINAIETVYA